MPTNIITLLSFLFTRRAIPKSLTNDTTTRRAVLNYFFRCNRYARVIASVNIKMEDYSSNEENKDFLQHSVWVNMCCIDSAQPSRFYKALRATNDHHIVSQCSDLKICLFPTFSVFLLL